jgi:hypothetical protein
MPVERLVTRKQAKKVRQRRKAQNKPKEGRRKARNRAGATIGGGADYSRAPKSVNPNGNQAGRVRGQGNPSAGVKAHVHHACALTNPFCPAARGYRIPDGKGFNTIGQQFRGRITMPGGLGSGSTTGNMLVLSAAAPYGIVGITSSTLGPPATYTSNATLTEYLGNAIVAANCGNYRIVSFGVVVRVASACNNTSGILSLNTFQPSSSLFSVAFTGGSPDFIEQFNVPMASGEEFTWVSKPMGSTAAQFVPQSTSSSLAQNGPTWTSLIIETSSSSSTTALDIEYFLNVEAEINSYSSLVHMAPPPVTPNPVGLKARDTIQQKQSSAQPGGTTTLETQMYNWATNEISTMLKGVTLEEMLGFLAFA